MADKKVTVYLSQNHEEYKKLWERAEGRIEGSDRIFQSADIKSREGVKSYMFCREYIFKNFQGYIYHILYDKVIITVDRDCPI